MGGDAAEDELGGFAAVGGGRYVCCCGGLGCDAGEEEAEGYGEEGEGDGLVLVC